MKNINGIIYDYYSESGRILSPIKPYIGLARYSGQAIDDTVDRNLRSLSKQHVISGSSDRGASYSAIVASLWDEILPIDQRSPTHWLDCGYVRSGKIESILCIPLRLQLPGSTPQSSAIKLAGYLVAIIEQIPTPTWTDKQPISIDFSERYTEIVLKGLITGWAHERGLMDRVRDALRV